MQTLSFSPLYSSVLSDKTIVFASPMPSVWTSRHFDSTEIGRNDDHFVAPDAILGGNQKIIRDMVTIRLSPAYYYVHYPSGIFRQPTKKFL